MKKRILFFILFFLSVGVISVIEGLFNSENGYLQLVLAFLSSVAVFYMPHLGLKLRRIPTAILFLLNSAALVYTYLEYHKIFLIDMLILSYIVWGIVTPGLLRYKSLLPLAFITSFTTVYAISLSDFSIPLYIVVFYPVYVLGAIIYNRNVIYNKKTIIFDIFNLVFSGSLLILFLFEALGINVVESILFLNIKSLGTKTAVYLPFIALFMGWFSASLNFLIYMPFSKFDKRQESLELTTYSKSVLNFISFLLIATISAFACEYSIRQDFMDTLNNILKPNLLFNILIIGSIYLCLIALLGKGISNIIISVFTIFLTIANYIKITYFDEPFYPWDLYLVQNLLGICKEYLNIPVLIIVIAAIAVGIAMIVRYRHVVRRYLKPKLTVVLIPFAAFLFIVSANILTNYSLSSQIGIMKSWYIGKGEILTNGVFAQNYYYLDDLDKYLNPKPEGYSQEAMQAISKKYENTKKTETATTVSKDVKPNVVMIMSESFWDITKLKGISYSKDIMANVHKYQNGQIAPPVIGGGTANTEFEALTGMSMYFMGPGIITYNAFLRTETPSLASVFKSNGYDTTAIHPNVGWFYNRDKVYNYLGFDRFIDINGFNQSTQIKGTNISDDAFVDKILDTLNSSDKPTFIFALSIENHDPYDGKYVSHDVDVNSDKLDSTHLDIVTNYAQGIYDADQSFGELVDAISKSDKPTLVYFFGDHAPRLGSLDDYYSIYDSLGTDDKSAQNQGLDNLKYFITPFASYSNYREMPKWSEILSPSHIAYEILNDSGVKYPNYFNILNKLEDKFPVMHSQTKNVIDEKSQTVKDYQLMQYDLLFGKKYLGK